MNALVRVAPADLFTTGYGALVVAKAVALVALGALGLGAPQADGRPRCGG